MINKQITRLLDLYPPEIKQLIDVVLEHEQRFISYQLLTNSSKLKEVKQKIKTEIETLSKNYEA